MPKAKFQENLDAPPKQGCEKRSSDSGRMLGPLPASRWRAGRLFRIVLVSLLTAAAAHPQPGPADPDAANISFNNFRDASLFEVLEILARSLRINYVVDPAVRDGSVTINTYGVLSTSDLFPLLETILRMNGAAAVQVGNLYRIVPLDGLARMPIEPQSSDAELPDDERMVLNAVRLDYSSAAELAEVLEPFLGVGGRYSVIEAANTLIVLDNSRNMRRTMELVEMFDAPELASQRMRLFEVEYSLATTLAAELEEVFQTLALSERQQAIRFLPLPRISALLAVSASEAALAEAEAWTRKLDRAATVGGVRNFVYRVQYGLAENLAATVTQLYGSPVASGESGVAADPSGLFTGNAGGGSTASPLLSGHTVRVVPDQVNNAVLVQATQQEWDVIRKTLLDLDAPPRQVLIDAKIYEVSLSGSLSSGVSAYLRNRSSNGATGKLTGGFDVGGVTSLSIGMLVGSTRALALFLEASANEGRTKVISAPSLIATDNIPAEIVVGQTIPTLSSQAVAGGTFSEGSSLFTNTISNVQTGVRLSVTARVNASGIVTLQILQEVSTPTGITGPIQSPTIDRRTVRTQVTVNDGDTVAIGGIIQETETYDAARVPVLGRIPVLGWAFGGTRQSRNKTELIVLLEPHVIYDQNQIVSASEELRNRLQSLRRLMRSAPSADQKRSEKIP